MTLIEEIRNKCSPELLASRDQAVVNTNTVTVTYTTSLTSS